MTEAKFEWLLFAVKIKKTSCPTVKHSTIDSAQNFVKALEVSIVATCSSPNQRNSLHRFCCDVLAELQAKFFSVTKPFSIFLRMLTEIKLEFRGPQNRVQWLRLPTRNRPTFNVFLCCTHTKSVVTVVGERAVAGVLTT